MRPRSEPPRGKPLSLVFGRLLSIESPGVVAGMDGSCWGCYSMAVGRTIAAGSVAVVVVSRKKRVVGLRVKVKNKRRHQRPFVLVRRGRSLA